MSLADLDPETLRQTRNNTQLCTVRHTTATLTDTDANKLHDLLYDRQITAAALSRALAGHGINIPAAHITTHRRGECVGCRENR